MRCPGLVVLGLVVLSVLIGWWVIPTGWTPRTQADVAAARRLMAAGDFEKARVILAQVNNNSSIPGGEVGYWLGVCEHGLGRPEAALDAWRKVPPKTDFATASRLALGQTLVGDFGRFAEAERPLAEGARGDGPDAVEARHVLTQVLFYQGRLSEMRGLIEDDWSRMPDRVKELKDHWRIDHVTPDLETIRSAVDSASEKAPEDDRVRLAKAYLDTLEGRYDDARLGLDRCLESRPEDEAVWQAVLRWARRSNDPEEAERALEHLKRDGKEAREALAWLAERRGDLEQAARRLQQVIELGPVDSEILGRLVAVNQRLARTSEADALRDRLREAQRDDVRYRELIEQEDPSGHFEELALVAERLGRQFEALGWTTLALERKPGDRNLLGQLQRLEAAQGNSRQSAEEPRQ